MCGSTLKNNFKRNNKAHKIGNILITLKPILKKFIFIQQDQCIIHIKQSSNQMIHIL